jgi:hypothetical protein
MNDDDNQQRLQQIPWMTMTMTMTTTMNVTIMGSTRISTLLAHEPIVT